MEKKEIIDSGFFRALLSNYVDHYCSYHYMDHDRLIYALCNSIEEKNIATREEIGVIKKKIRELGHEEMSFDFLMRYQSKNPHAYSEQENNPAYWENHFCEFFLGDVESLMPFTEANRRIEKLPEKIEELERKDVDDELLIALERMDSETRDVPFLIQCEEDIIDQIEADIEYYKENDYWDIELDFYEGYREYSDALKMLFDLSDLLVQLFRLRMFEEFLEIDHEDQIKSRDAKPNGSTKNNLELLKTNKSTVDFLIGSDSIKSGLLEFLIKNYSGKKGKNIAIMILALEENILIAYTEKSELYSALRIDFGNIGSDSSINKFLTINLRMDKDHLKIVSLHSEKIKKHIENLPK